MEASALLESEEAEEGAALSVVPNDDVTSDHDCRIPGCPRSAKSNRGRYAYLCDQHSADKAAGRLREDGTRGDLHDALVGAAGEDPGREKASVASPTWPSRPETPPDGRTLASAVRALERPAKRLERACAARRSARAEAKAAVEEFNEALRAVRELAAALIQ